MSGIDTKSELDTNIVKKALQMRQFCRLGDLKQYVLLMDKEVVSYKI